MYLPTSWSTVGQHIGHYLGQASVEYQLSLKQALTGRRPLQSILADSGSTVGHYFASGSPTDHPHIRSPSV